MLVVCAILGLQLAASISFYARIEREGLREDHAHRVAELLVVSQRVHALTQPGQADVGRILTTSYLEVSVTPQAPPRSLAHDPEAAAIQAAIVRWEPALAETELSTWMRRNSVGGEDLMGAMRLADGQWLSFRSRDFAGAWPLALRVTLMTVLFAGLCLVFAVFVLAELGRPLRNLARAARAIGHGPQVPVSIEGSADLREVERAFNEMQHRIASLMADQARAMDAISHDLRTPLARLQLAAEFAQPEEVRSLFAANVAELDQMLHSLSAYLRAQHQPSAAEAVDLAKLIRDTLAPFGNDAVYRGPDTLIRLSHRGPVTQALRLLVDNAVRHGGGAEVSLEDGPTPLIRISDHGSGMSGEDLDQIYEPFFRGDRARSRDTAGFGLGVPTAAHLLTRFGGGLTIVNAPDGGLLVTLTPP